MLWVTRPHPHIDRTACAWLIRRFVVPNRASPSFPIPSPLSGSEGSLSICAGWSLAITRGAARSRAFC